MIWKLEDIDPWLYDIKRLFEKNKDHKHKDNYIKKPLFEHTKFARMGWDNWDNMVYYSAGIARPEYNGGIRIMSRHTRDRNYNWGTMKDDLQRGNATLSHSTKMALEMGYKDIWVSREENPKLLEWFQKHNFYSWNITYEQLHYGGMQYVLRLDNGKVFR